MSRITNRAVPFPKTKAKERKEKKSLGGVGEGRLLCSAMHLHLPEDGRGRVNEGAHQSPTHQTKGTSSRAWKRYGIAAAEEEGELPPLVVIFMYTDGLVRRRQGGRDESVSA